MLVVCYFCIGLSNGIQLTGGTDPSRSSWQIVSASSYLPQLLGLYLLLVLDVDRHKVVEERLANSKTLIDICLDFLELTLTQQWSEHVLFNDCPESLVIDILE